MRVPTKSEVISSEIRNMIFAGKYPVGTTLPSERTLAQSFGSTQVTINKAISMLVAEGVVEKRHGSGNYVKSNSGIKDVCFLIEEVGQEMNPLWHRAYEAFSMCTVDSHLRVSSYIIPTRSDEIPANQMKDADVIIAAIALNPERVANVLDLRTPVVWLEEYPDELPGVTICFDNRKAGEMAAQHLAEVGCRRALYLTYQMDIESNGFLYYPDHQRFTGFQEASRRDAKLECSLQSFPYPNSTQELIQNLDSLLYGGDEVDGVFCFSDALMPFVARGAMEVGRRMPGDLAVIGVDGLPFCESFIPTLSTLRQPMEKIGKLAYQTAENLLNGVATDRVQYVDPELFIRESTSGYVAQQ